MLLHLNLVETLTQQLNSRAEDQARHVSEVKRPLQRLQHFQPSLTNTHTTDTSRRQQVIKLVNLFLKGRGRFTEVDSKVAISLLRATYRTQTSEPHLHVLSIVVRAETAGSKITHSYSKLQQKPLMSSQHSERTHYFKLCSG